MNKLKKIIKHELMNDDNPGIGLEKENAIINIAYFQKWIHASPQSNINPFKHYDSAIISLSDNLPVF